ncbi:MAG: cell division FtsZ family protein [Deltaproteobacteria bacterium]|jgi:cell division protein FtsZ|nr:cell division FtsZ family protein [Deltaproteobacteria bacterium]
MEKRNHHVFKVFGLGGCGINAVRHMIASGLKGADFVAADTDVRVLRLCPAAAVKIQIGIKTAKGGGCGRKADKGCRSAEENMPEILAALAGSDLVFLAAGLGGGTGSGGLPAVAKALSELDKPPLIVAVVTMPFTHEDFKLPEALAGLNELYRYCSSVISIDNTKLETMDSDAPFMENKKAADEILYRAVSSIIDIVEKPGEINIDFADVASVLVYPGPAIISFGEASGEKRASEALKAAISNPLMADSCLSGAQAVICNITADSKILVREVTEINRQIHQAVGPMVKLFFGLVIDESLKDTATIRVTILASGLGLSYLKEEASGPAPGLFDGRVPLDTVLVDMEPKVPGSLAPQELTPQQLDQLGIRPHLEVVSPAPKIPAGPEGYSHAAPVRRALRQPLDRLQGQPASPFDGSPGVNMAAQNQGAYDQFSYKIKPAD